MPRPVRGARTPTPNWWGVTVPTTKVTSTTATWVGVRCDFTVAGRVFGLSAYKDALYSPELLGVFYDESVGTLLAARAWRPQQPASSEWENVWFHPVVRVNLTHFYRVFVLFPNGQYYRTVGALASSVIHNGIEFLGGFQTTSLNFGGALTNNTNANGVDVLFQPD